MPIGTDFDCFVTKATGRVHIPSAGNWTFGVNSDDGFSCTVNGQTFAYDGLRSPGDSFGTINFAAAGDYDLSLVFFENGGGSSLELFAASGQKSAFDSTFRLVGDTANGGLAVQSAPFTGSGNSSAFANAVKTNVAAGHAGGEQHLVVHADHLRCARPGVVAELDAQDAVRRRVRGVSERRRGGAAERPDHGDLELAGRRGAHQRRSSHDVREHRRLGVSQLRHDRPPHGHRQRPGDSGDEILA